MSAVNGVELEPIDEKFLPAVNRASELLQVVRSNNSLGLKQLCIDDFTPYEFELLSYLSSEVTKLQRQKK